MHDIVFRELNKVVILLVIFGRIKVEELRKSNVVKKIRGSYYSYGNNKAVEEKFQMLSNSGILHIPNS